jgi:hypothetical protein
MAAMDHYEKIVVGSSFDAVLYAFVKQYPIFFAEERRPFRFDYLKPDIDLSTLKIPLEPKPLTTLSEAKVVGYSKELLWEKLLFLMAVQGKAPLSNLCGTIRYDGETAVCANEYSKIMEFTFDECYYFGDNNVHGFVEQKEVDSRRYMCYDYIGFHSGGKHTVDYIKTQDEFVKEIWFYASDRIDGATPIRDACAVSILSEEELLHFDYSQTMARFKALHEMETRGMKGKYAGEETSAGNPKHYKFRTTSLYRETSPKEITGVPRCHRIQIGQKNEEALLKDIPSACVAYDRLLRYW